MYFCLIVYYRTMNMFIFVYNVSDKQSFEKIAENYQHIKTLAKGTNLHCLLIGMHFSPKHKIVRNLIFRLLGFLRFF